MRSFRINSIPNDQPDEFRHDVVPCLHPRQFSDAHVSRPGGHRIIDWRTRPVPITIANQRSHPNLICPRVPCDQRFRDFHFCPPKSCCPETSVPPAPVLRNGGCGTEMGASRKSEKVSRENLLFFSDLHESVPKCPAAGQRDGTAGHLGVSVPLFVPLFRGCFMVRFPLRTAGRNAAFRRLFRRPW